MIHKKGAQLYVTFYTSADAMALERACRAAGLPGRLLPVPRSITSDCGVAWATAPGQRTALTALLEQAHLEVAGIFETEE